MEPIRGYDWSPWLFHSKADYVDHMFMMTDLEVLSDRCLKFYIIGTRLSE